MTEESNMFRPIFAELFNLTIKWEVLICYTKNLKHVDLKQSSFARSFKCCLFKSMLENQIFIQSFM